LIPERLTERRNAAGISQSELARRVGIGQSSASRLEAGGTRNPRQIVQIARILGTTPEYLTGETDDPAPTTEIKLVAHAAANSDMVEIAEFNLAYGLGGTYIHDAPAERVMRPFSKVWVRQFTQSPIEQLFWATGSGTSMMPAILDSDILLIDTGQQTPRMWDHVWAIEMHGLGMIKALRPGKEGAMRILSLNPDYPEEVAYDGEMNVIGRVVAIVRKI
jgi:phage repressor protein C with HTH and peptisase S24 domain